MSLYIHTYIRPETCLYLCNETTHPNYHPYPQRARRWNDPQEEKLIQLLRCWAARKLLIQSSRSQIASDTRNGRSGIATRSEWDVRLDPVDYQGIKSMSLKGFASVLMS